MQQLKLITITIQIVNFFSINRYNLPFLSHSLVYTCKTRHFNENNCQELEAPEKSNDPFVSHTDMCAHL